MYTLPHSQGILYMLGVLNPGASLVGGMQLDIFLGGMATLLILYLANILLILPYVACVFGRYAVEMGLSSVSSFRTRRKLKNKNSAGLYKLNEGAGNYWWQVAAVIMLVSTNIWYVPISIPLLRLRLLSSLDHTQSLQHYPLKMPFFCGFSNGLNNVYLTLHLVNKQNLLLKKLIIIWLRWTVHKEGNIINWSQFVSLNFSCHGVYCFKIRSLHGLQRNFLRTISLPSNWQIWMFLLNAN